MFIIRRGFCLFCRSFPQFQQANCGKLDGSVCRNSTNDAAAARVLRGRPSVYPAVFPTLWKAICEFPTGRNPAQRRMRNRAVAVFHRAATRLWKTAWRRRRFHRVSTAGMWKPERNRHSAVPVPGKSGKNPAFMRFCALAARRIARRYWR